MTGPYRNASQPDRYWITLPNDELGQAVRERFDKYLDERESRGHMALYRLAARRYYGGTHFGGGDSSSISHGGEQGETSELTLNQYGSILTSLLSLATASRPAWQTSARTDSAEALASVQLCDQILEYELQRGAEMEAIDGVRRMLLFQESGIGVFWHPEEGDVVAVEDVQGPDGMPQQKPVKAGEMRIEALSPFDVARDLRERSIRDVSWIIVRRRFNKWDLAALYPEHTETVLGTPGVDQDDRDRGIRKGAEATHGTTDMVYVHELYAMRTAAVPMGRYARVVGSTCVEAGDLQYERLPVSLHSPERTVDEATGSSRTVDLLAPQQAYDSVMSNLLSNNDAFGRGNVLMPKGADVDVRDIGGGLQVIEYNAEAQIPPPGPLEMPRLSTADMQFAESLASVMQVLSGINSVVRGDPEESLKSGAALALVQAMSVQHNSGLQRATAELIESIGTRILETYRAFATVPRMIEITGSDEQRTAREFVGGDLDDVMSVRVELANPLLRTLAGKKELADFYADPARWQDQSLTKADHMAFIATGRLPRITSSARSRALAIQEECEALIRGEPTQVLVTDHHEAHIIEHVSLLNGRRRMELGDEIIKGIDAHIQAHGAAWVTATIQNPALLAATGQRPAPLPMMPAAPPGGPGAPANDNGSPPAANDNAQQPGQQAPPGAPPMPAATGGEPKGPGMPNMPTNPATGQRAQMPGGGMQ